MADGCIRPENVKIFEDNLKPGGRVPIVQTPDDFHIFVAGGSPGYDLLFTYPGPNWANQTKTVETKAAVGGHWYLPSPCSRPVETTRAGMRLLRGGRCGRPRRRGSHAGRNLDRPQPLGYIRNEGPARTAKPFGNNRIDDTGSTKQTRIFAERPRI